MSALITRTAGEVVTTSGRLPQAAKRLPSALLTSDGHRRRGGRHGLSERPPGTGDRAPSSPDRRVVDVSGAGPTSSFGPGCMRIGRPGPPRDARGQAKDVSRPGWRGRTRIGHRGRRPRSVSVAGARRRRVRTPDRHPVQRLAVPPPPRSGSVRYRTHLDVRPAQGVVPAGSHLNDRGLGCWYGRHRGSRFSSSSCSRAPGGPAPTGQRSR